MSSVGATNQPKVQIVLSFHAQCLAANLDVNAFRQRPSETGLQSKGVRSAVQQSRDAYASRPDSQRTRCELVCMLADSARFTSTVSSRLRYIRHADAASTQTTRQQTNRLILMKHSLSSTLQISKNWINSSHQLETKQKRRASINTKNCTGSTKKESAKKDAQLEHVHRV